MRIHGAGTRAPHRQQIAGSGSSTSAPHSAHTRDNQQAGSPTGSGNRAFSLSPIVIASLAHYLSS
jgi:hypothetical protein